MGSAATQGDPRTRRHGEVGSHEGGWSLTKAHATTTDWEIYYKIILN